MKRVLQSLLEDNAGGYSSIRVFMLLWFLCLAPIWIYVCYKTQTIADIPTGVLGFTAMIVGGKVVQRFGEKAVVTLNENEIQNNG